MKWGRSTGWGSGLFWLVLKLGKNGVAEGGWRWLCVDERERGQCMGLLRVQGRKSWRRRWFLVGKNGGMAFEREGIMGVGQRLGKGRWAGKNGQKGRRWPGKRRLESGWFGSEKSKPRRRRLFWRRWEEREGGAAPWKEMGLGLGFSFFF